MKTALHFACMIMIASLLISGCANSRGLIAKASIGSKQDVFTDVLGKEVPSGKAIADIKFSVKSISSRFPWSYNKHNDPPFTVHLNIDGQATVLETEPVLEKISPIDSNVPESGTGWKYRFSKQIALAPGKHKLRIVLPVDDVIVEQEIVLRDGVNTINLKPIYKKRLLRPYKGESFTAGVKSIEVVIE
ncbi:lipoprotein, putative [Geotalea daltonii FRC-32]|uniref:Lipoprotein, putative n=1 Tax=Geotalea daltonii (strain DSM 22248 / JCM 15807 / FRC-32) TaxID=316067 RepID=B9M7J6_GEODF|nr:hypothetical protein [Geotalea daltonii]ACM22102.1 lipoprotein, putative [Geotalea daltonii FRC-32]